MRTWSILALTVTLASCAARVTPQTDAAVPEDTGWLPPEDTGAPEDAVDSSVSPVDTGGLTSDTGFPTPDTGTVTMDTGAVTTDTGAVPEDTGIVTTDTGTVLPLDGGPSVDRRLPGPHTVGVWTGTIAGTQGNARVFYPTTAGTERFPLVAFAHGFQLAVNNYDTLLRHVASYGYVVASVDYPGNLLNMDHRDVAAALSSTRRAFTGTVPGFPGRADSSRAIAMGHSLGGKGAIMAVIADPAFIVAFAIDPVDDNPVGSPTAQRPSVAPEMMSGLRVPLGLVGTTQSRCAVLGTACAPVANDYHNFSDSAPSTVPHPTWVLRDFGHMDMVDSCGLLCATCARGSTPLDARLAALRAITVSFLERYVRDDPSAQDWIGGAERAAAVASGVLWNNSPDTLPACR